MAPPLSAAESQQRYRARRDADPERRQQYLENGREKWKRDREKGIHTGINDVSEREKRAKRKKWREAKRATRAKARRSQDTPPATPDNQPETGSGPPRQRRQGEKRTRIGRRKLQRDMALLKAQLDREIRSKEKWKKRYSRCKTSSSSPRAVVNRMLQKQKVTPHVRKTLTFHSALVADIAQAYKTSKRETVKQTIAKVTCGKLLKKYRLQSFAFSALGFSKKRGKSYGDAELTSFQRKKSSRRAESKASIRTFFLRDDVSRMTTGRKETITARKRKMQKRLLTDTLKNLHRRFASESSDNVSYCLFCSCRPFLVVTPTDADRATCQCKTHENLQFMADTLYSRGLVDSKNLEEMADRTVCATGIKICAYGDCGECKHTAYPTLKAATMETIQVVQWLVEKIGEEEKKTITIKKEMQTTEADLIDNFQDCLFKFRKHLFNIRWQYGAYRQLRESLQANECLIHIDFSENYSCKYHKEIQSVHFGGSHQQATLHTGVLYTNGQTVPFCSISPSRRHDPPAIWAHMEPVLAMVKTKYPEVERLHFYSDGPATQYKQKGNFYLLSSEPFRQGFKDLSWNFFEASHGKGAPDGIGGTLKRSADRIVRLGEDVPDAFTLFQKLKGLESTVQLFFVSEDDVEAKTEVPALTPIKGTMRMHQVISLIPGQIKYRDISCFCQRLDGQLDCACFDLKVATLDGVPVPPPTQTPPTQTPPTENRETPWRPEEVDSKYIGDWCVVKYDDDVYPGIIMDVEEHSIRVKCMHRNGVNKFCWPSPRDDVSWYADDQLLCLIPEPQALNKRSVQLEKSTWKYMEDHYVN
ncbi:uncharacterized protein LOC133642309 [Entelurus aequoreus]|uniref:uncharacterized protein LOC133642309 n=1 Tax=Entelurus aequoreus TaxID=161455 RepID=UPI002B1D99DD|nr:uncharacterized protein LOC133642309 [Entelurus aequoreus]